MNMKKIIKYLVFFMSGWFACSVFTAVRNTVDGEMTEETCDTVRVWPFEIHVGCDQGTPTRECRLFNYPLLVHMVSSPEEPVWIDDCFMLGSMDETVPASFRGEYAKAPDGWNVRILSLNGKRLQKPVMVKPGTDDSDEMQREGKECAGVMDVIVPTGQESEPDTWRPGSATPWLMKEGSSSHGHEMDDIVLKYYHRQEMEVTRQYADMLDQMAKEKESPFRVMELAACGSHRFRWMSLTAYADKTVYAGYFRRNREELVQESADAENELRDAVERWESSLGRRLLEKEGNLQIRMWGIPVPFFVNIISGACSSGSGS